jgi:hypothetical protein
MSETMQAFKLGCVRQIRFTPERIQQIINLVERGKKKDEIAEIVGLAPAMLQRICSKLRISLQRPSVATHFLRRKPNSPDRRRPSVDPTQIGSHIEDAERGLKVRAISIVERMFNDPQGAKSMAMIYVAKVDCKVELPPLLESALIQYAKAKPIDIQTEVERWRANVRADQDLRSNIKLCG